MTPDRRHENDVRKPAETVLLGERARDWREGRNPADIYGEYWDLCYDSWEPNGNWLTGHIGYPPVWVDNLDPERHNDGANWAFCDGHVKWMRFEQTVRSQSDNMHDLH